MKRLFGLTAIFALSLLPAAAQTRSTRADLMAEAAKAFLETLDPRQRSQVLAPLGDEAARTDWHYLPVDTAPRGGVALADLTPGQRKAAHAMVAEALSSQGYGKLTHIMWMEDYLRAAEGAALARANLSGDALKARQARLASRDPAKYFVRLFGEPGSGNWGWTVSGHHFAVNFTVAGGRVAFTPLFVGANPQTIPDGSHAGETTLQHAINKAFRLVLSLSATQRAAVVVSADVPQSLVADKGKQDTGRRFAGMPASRLDPGQRVLLMSLVDEFLEDTAEETAAAQKALITRDGPGALRLAWWGPTGDPAQRFMFRVHSPSILIEFVRERTADGGPANHVHAIVRDPSNDYGSAWLGQHYREHHRQ